MHRRGENSRIVIENYMEGENLQDEAKIIETEEAEENDFFMHKNKENKEISSIDMTNGLGEISDFNSEENLMFQPQGMPCKPSFVTESESSSNEKSKKIGKKHQEFYSQKIFQNSQSSQISRPTILNKYLYRG